MCAPIDPNLDWDSAATVTLGAIAMQGIRRAQPSLGETFAIIGLGVLGQLTAQILKVNGLESFLKFLKYLLITLFLYPAATMKSL